MRLTKFADTWLKSYLMFANALCKNSINEKKETNTRATHNCFGKGTNQCLHNGSGVD